MLHEIKDVEIFATGKWNGTEFTEKDIDAVIGSFGQEKVGFEPPLKLGHDKKQKLLQTDGYPAAGWVASLKKVGNKITANFKDLPLKVYELLKNKAYKVPSVELYKNYVNKDGQKFPYVLKAVSLLGADIPAVEGLSDMLSLYDQEGKEYYICTADNLSNEQYARKSNKEGRDKDMPTELEIKLQKDLDKKNAMLKDLEKQLAALKKGSEGNAKLAKDIEILSKKAEGMEAELKEEKKKRTELEMERKTEKIDALVDSYVGKKISPAQAPILKEMLMRTNGEKTLTFSKDGKEEKLTMTEAVERFVSLQEELFTVEVTKEGVNLGDDDEAKVLAFCKEKGLDPNKIEDYKYAYAHALS